MAAFLVEDGSGLAAANSFASVAFADEYHTDRGNTGWTGTDAIKEQHLRKATEALMQLFGRRWLGTRTTETQALDWPREEIVTQDGHDWPEDELPAELAQATAYLALQSLTGDTFFTALTAPQNIKRERTKVGPIEEEFEYFGSKEALKRYPVLPRLLLRFITAGNEVLRG